MKTAQRGFIVPLLLIIIALLLAGGGAYVYTQSKSAKGTPPPTLSPGNEATKTSTLVGAVYNSVYIKDAKTLIFIDTNNKQWTVNYENANYSCVSGVRGAPVSTTKLQDWLKMQVHLGTPPSVEGAPGTLTITGVLDDEGVLNASSIQESGQCS